MSHYGSSQSALGYDDMWLLDTQKDYCWAMIPCIVKKPKCLNTWLLLDDGCEGETEQIHVRIWEPLNHKYYNLTLKITLKS